MEQHQGGEEISLHDCCVSCLKTDGRALTLCFPDGIWLLENNRLNTVGKTVRTGRTQVTLKDFAFSTFTVMKPTPFFGKKRSSFCDDVTFEKLKENVNSGKWTVEFIDDFKNADSHLFHVIILKKKKQYDCFWKVKYEGLEYCFEGIQKDRVW